MSEIITFYIPVFAQKWKAPFRINSNASWSTYLNSCYSYSTKYIFTCANPAFSNAHGIDSNADPIIVFHIDKIVVKEEFLVPEAIAIADPLILNDLKISNDEPQFWTHGPLSGCTDFSTGLSFKVEIVHYGQNRFIEQKVRFPDSRLNEVHILTAFALHLHPFQFHRQFWLVVSISFSLHSVLWISELYFLRLFKLWVIGQVRVRVFLLRT